MKMGLGNSKAHCFTKLKSKIDNPKYGYFATTSFIPLGDTGMGTA